MEEVRPTRSELLERKQQISLAQRAQSIATGAVAGQLAQSIGNALNLDTFEIQVAPENGGGPTPQVTREGINRQSWPGFNCSATRAR